MPVTIRINGVAGSDENAVNFFTPVAAVVLDSPATVVYSWEFLDWPLDTAFNDTWIAPLVANANITFTPDTPGTWLVKLTDTNDGTSEIIIVGVTEPRTAIRIPSAGETEESANTVYPFGGAVTNHRGWALTRNLGLETLNELSTSGGVQLCYLEDAGMPAQNAGFLVSLVHGASQILDPTTGEMVPQVQRATATFVSNDYAYVGAVRAARDDDPPVVSDVPYGYITTGITTGRFVWVTTSGLVYGGAAGTLNFTAPTWTVGDIVYVGTAGGVYQNTDPFADPATPELMIPAGIVADTTNNPGSMIVLPNRYFGSAVAAAKTLKYLGIGDFSNIRVGRSDGASVAGESDGTIELVAVNNDAVPIAVGEVACITSLAGVQEAYRADSAMDAASNKRDGIFGIAVETVAAGAIGHFTIFGLVTNVVAPGPVAGGALYVGSSTSYVGNMSGQAVILDHLEDASHLVANAATIPLGVWDGTHLLMGTCVDEGLVGVVGSSRSKLPNPWSFINYEFVTDSLRNMRANVYKEYAIAPYAAVTSVEFPNTAYDPVLSPSSIYEDTLKVGDLYDFINTTLAGKTYGGGMDVLGAPLYNGLWDPSGGGADPANILYGSYVIDDIRFQPGLTPVKITIYGYVDNNLITADVGLTLKARFNYLQDVNLNDYFVEDTGIVSANGAATQTAFTCETFLTGGNNAFYVPFGAGSSGLAAANVQQTIDITIERADVAPAPVFDVGVMIERVVLEAFYPNKQMRKGEFVPVAFEKKIPGHAIFDIGTGFYNILDESGSVNNQPTIGSSMTAAGLRNSSDLSGFIPTDVRYVTGSDLTIKVYGKYQGAAGGPQSIDLELWARAEEAGNTYDPDIQALAPLYLVGVGSQTPGGSAVGNYELLTFTWVIAASALPSPALGGGLRFHINRIGVDPLTTGAGEDWFMITNVSLEAGRPPDPQSIEDTFEDSTSLTNVVDNADDAFNVDYNFDFNGFLFSDPTAPGHVPEELYIPIKLDKRYDYRDNLDVTILGWVETDNASPITLSLGLDSWYQFNTVLSDGSYTTFDASDASITGAIPGGEVKLIKHVFTIPADVVWKARPAGNIQFRSSDENSALMLKVERTDSVALNYMAMTSSVYASSGKLEDNAEPYINISESTEADKHHFVKGAYTFDNIPSTVGLRNILTSAHRLSFIYGLDGDRVLDTGSIDLFPAGCVGGPTVTPTQGYLIPFSMAIMGVYAMGVDTDGGPTPMTGSVITLHVKDNGGGTIDTSPPSIWHMPLTVTGVVGGWRWCGNDLNFSGADSKEIPLIYLPSDYATTATKWWLTAEFTNNGGADMDLNLNVMVEVAFLQSNNVLG